MGWFRDLIQPFQPPTEEPSDAKAASGSQEFVRTIQEGWWTDAYGAMYRNQPAVRAAVDWLGRNIAQLNPKVYERVSNNDRLELGAHPLAVLLRSPNPLTSRYSLMRDTVSDLAVFDRAVWVKGYNRGRLVTVDRRPPSQMIAKQVNGVTVWHGPAGQTYTRKQLVLFHGYSPDGDENGVSPMETLRRVLNEDKAALEHRANMWRNSARQSGWVERPADAPRWSDEARTRFRHDLESTMSGGANAGRIGILEEGMSWNGNSFSPRDTEYHAGRHLTYEEVCIAFGLKASLLGLGNDTAASSETSHRHAYQDVLGPWLRWLQDEIELQMLRDFEPFTTGSVVYVEFNLAEKLKGSFEEQSKSIVSSVGVPYMSVNEGRALRNLPRIDQEWADSPVQPLNVMYGGQPAVTQPTADPGTASALPQVKSAAQPSESHRDDAAREHATMLREFFEEQERVIVAERTSKAERVTEQKWNGRLQEELYELARLVTNRVGVHTAGQLSGRYDTDRTTPWLHSNTERNAKDINKKTFAAVEQAEDLDGVRQVFADAKASRADVLGASAAATLVNFARNEAGKQTAETGRIVNKTWIVTSGARSRHPEMSGQKVPVDSTFSNGARWPGDSVLGADGAANCRCLLEIGD